MIQNDSSRTVASTILDVAHAVPSKLSSIILLSFHLEPRALRSPFVYSQSIQRQIHSRLLLWINTVRIDILDLFATRVKISPSTCEILRGNKNLV
ncbi:hypothetical protein BT96DRAFT_929991, partial [Gymnopus androsaceus JB14]